MIDWLAEFALQLLEEWREHRRAKKEAVLTQAERRAVEIQDYEFKAAQRELEDIHRDELADFDSLLRRELKMPLLPWENAVIYPGAPWRMDQFGYLAERAGIQDQQLGQLHQLQNQLQQSPLQSDHNTAQNIGMQIQALAQQQAAMGQQQSPLNGLLGQLGSLNGLNDSGVLGLLGYGRNRNKPS